MKITRILASVLSIQFIFSIWISLILTMSTENKVKVGVVGFGKWIIAISIKVLHHLTHASCQACPPESSTVLWLHPLLICIWLLSLNATVTSPRMSIPGSKSRRARMTSLLMPTLIWLSLLPPMDLITLWLLKPWRMESMVSLDGGLWACAMR